MTLNRVTVIFIVYTHSFILAYTSFVKTMYKITEVNRATNAATISRDSAAISQLFSANSGNASTDNSLVPRPTHVSLGTRLVEYVMGTSHCR